MPEQKTIERARKDAQERKAPGTQAGEFMREEMEYIRKGRTSAVTRKKAGRAVLKRRSRLISGCEISGENAKKRANGDALPPSASKKQAG